MMPTVPQNTSGLARYALVEEDRAVDGGNAHAVAVVAHAGDDAAASPAAGASTPWRQLLRRRSPAGRSRTHRCCRSASRASPVPSRSRMTPPKPGVRPAVRLDGRGVVVRLDLEADVMLVVELHDAGVVREDADAPVVGAELRGELPASPRRSFLSAGCRMRCRSAVSVIVPLQRLVRAVFATRSARSFPARRRSGRGSSSRKCAWIAFISSSVSASCRPRLSFTSPASSSLRDRHGDAPERVRRGRTSR